MAEMLVRLRRAGKSVRQKRKIDMLMFRPVVGVVSELTLIEKCDLNVVFVEEKFRSYNRSESEIVMKKNYV